MGPRLVVEWFSARVTALHNLGVVRAFEGDYDEAEVPLPGLMAIACGN